MYFVCIINEMIKGSLLKACMALIIKNLQFFAIGAKVQIFREK